MGYILLSRLSASGKGWKKKAMDGEIAVLTWFSTAIVLKMIRFADLPTEMSDEESPEKLFLGGSILLSQSGNQTFWSLQQAQRVQDMGTENCCRKAGFRGRTFGLKNGDAQSRLFQHKAVVSPISDTDDVFGTERRNKLSLGFVLGDGAKNVKRTGSVD
jgi:hypothetical protein